MTPWIPYRDSVWPHASSRIRFAWWATKRGSWWRGDHASQSHHKAENAETKEKSKEPSSASDDLKINNHATSTMVFVWENFAPWVDILQALFFTLGFQYYLGYFIPCANLLHDNFRAIIPMLYIPRHQPEPKKNFEKREAAKPFSENIFYDVFLASEIH